MNQLTDDDKEELLDLGAVLICVATIACVLTGLIGYVRLVFP